MVIRSDPPPSVSRRYDASSSTGAADIELTSGKAREDNANSGPRAERQVERVEEQPEVLTFQIKFKLLSIAFSFFCAGCNDGSIGVLVPYILDTYGIGTDLVAAIYASIFMGWLLAAFTNSVLLLYFDIGAILALGASLQLLAQVLRCWLPPFGLFCVAFFAAALGIAYQDSHSNSFATTVRGAHRWLAVIHASYALGLLISPFVANAIASTSVPSVWYYSYLFPLGLGIINVALVLIAFKDSLKFVVQPPVETSSSSQVDHVTRGSKAWDEMKTILQIRSVWLMSLFFLFHLGACFTASGWVVEYLVSVRHGNLAAMGYVPTGFNGGAFLGRVLLAEPSHRFGEKRMILIYCVACLGMQLLFWFVPSIPVNAVALSIMGFFFGPWFPTGVSVASKTFPRRVRPAALGFAFVMAQAGGALFPSITGVIASGAGVKVLQPIVTALIIGAGVAWILLPKPSQSQNSVEDE